MMQMFKDLPKHCSNGCPNFGTRCRERQWRDGGRAKDCPLRVVYECRSNRFYHTDAARALITRIGAASHRIECGLTGRTILNIDTEDVVTLSWALREYLENHEEGIL